MYKYSILIALMFCLCCKKNSSKDNFTEKSDSYEEAAETSVINISEEDIITKNNIDSIGNNDNTIVRSNIVKSVYIFNSKKEESKLKFSQIFDSTTVIKLETNKESLIGSPSKIKIFNNNIFILDRASKKLLEFNMKGKFVRAYGKKGKGPGEYVMPLSFDINEQTKELVIYDRAKRKLMLYELNGNFKYSIQLEFNASNFVLSSDYNEYIFDTHFLKQRKINNSDSKQYSIIKTNLKGKITSKFLEMNTVQNSIRYISNNSLFKSSSSKILFNKPFTNTIFQINNSSSSPFFNVKFQGKTIPEKYDYGVNFDEFIKKVNQNEFQYLDNLGGIFMINNRLLFSVKKGKEKENYIYNLKTEELYLIDKKTDNLSFGFLGTKICTYKNSLVNYASPFMYLNSKKYNSDKYNNTKVQNILKQTKEGDNPILIFNWFKS